MDLKFRYFLLNEDATYLTSRIGDILNALQDIQQNQEGMGTRQLVRNAERVVNQIRRIVHTNWGSNKDKPLEVLQRVGVAIKKGIEEKSDLKEILANCTNEIQDTLAHLGMPINKLGTQGAEGPEESKEQTGPPQGKEQSPEHKTQEQPAQNNGEQPALTNS